ncbi:MAG: Gfo/Idh/MocA family oxidoreductase [Clostridia bacterium]|nr:Gfo/Idh/MocA family oxidoreductase [Clostridia bacterium]
MNKPITAIIVGAGHRSLIYARYAFTHPDRLRIVGIADPDAERRKMGQEMFNLPDSMLFENAASLAARGKLADAVINGTMDQQHVETAIPLLAAGYDMLLEKPFALNEAELRALVDAVRRYNRKVMICHVLRYAPFYAEIRRRLPLLGKIQGIETTEHVSHHHMLVGYVRGKWRNTAMAGHHSMLLAKCCHDIDLIMWMKSGVAPVRVSSFGGMQQFRPENAPAGAGERCLVDCPAQVEADCPFSARKQYLEHPDRWTFYVWRDLENVKAPTLEQKAALLRRSDYGRCAYKMDTEVVDNQTVIIQFADGSIASHNMLSGTPVPQRTIHITGERGEITGKVDDSRFVLRVLDPHSVAEYREEVVDLNVLSGDTSGMSGGHAGGDERLVHDFVSVLLGETPSISCTSIMDSVAGHMTVFCADRAMETGSVVEIPALQVQ